MTTRDQQHIEHLIQQVLEKLDAQGRRLDRIERSLKDIDLDVDFISEPAAQSATLTLIVN